MVPGVRIAVDPRTSQVVVQAPPAIQTRMNQRVAELSPAAPPAAGKSPGHAPGIASANLSRSLSLRYVTAQQVEVSLVSMMGSRLSAIPTQHPQVRQVRLALAGGDAVDVTLDPAAARVTMEGSGVAIDACARLIQALDTPSENGGKDVRLLPLRTTSSAGIQRAVAAIRSTTGSQTASPPMMAMLFQPQGQRPTPTPPDPVRGAATPANQPPAGKPGESVRSGLVNPVQIEMLEGLDVLVLRGKPQDVEQVMEIIHQVERLSAETEPAIEVLPLRHVDCEAMGALVKSLYDEVFRARQGSVSITPVVKPNAVLIVGRPENVRTVVELVGRLDQPVVPNSQFQVFHLRNASAAAAHATIQEFFADRGGLGTLVRVTADVRSNALVIQASPRDMAEVAELIRRIDTSTSAAVNEVRIIQLEHSMAQDVANILQTAIGVATGGARGAMPGLQQPGAGPVAQGGQPQTDQRSAMLRFLTIDTKGRKLLNSGILSDVRITADVRANAVVVTAPPENLELIEALIRQLDQLPAAEAQIKVFTIVNGDAANLAEMLRSLFASQMAAGGQQGMGTGMGMGMGMMARTSVSGNQNAVVGLRFGVDTRTNSIIASGAMGDLNVVEAILTRLDDGEVRHRRSVVFRLKNAPAPYVANAINEFLRSERQVQQLAPGTTSAFEQIEREVVVVPETVSNSLILSATPRFFEEVRGIIEQLDARPPMVMIQVLIAQIELGNTEEFGVEVGLQDSVLFDRSILSNIQTVSTTATPVGLPTVTTQQVVAADNRPGYNFNNADPLGNSGSDKSLNKAGILGPQSLSNFAVGRTNNQLGFGGFVLSASSENVSFLLRALNENHRLEVLQRPQIMTLDNQPAFIQVGQRVPRITGTQVNNVGQVNTIALENVGLILGVTPRISPDGLVAMEIDAEKSEMGPDAEGIPVSSSEGRIIRSPRINTTTAQTTVSAMSDQTVVLGGLIAKSTNEFHRKVPLLGDIPLLGRLFRYDGTTNSRTELLIIMTPHIVRNESDMEAIKRAEAARMSWCLGDVIKIYGDAGLRGRTDRWSDAETQVIYPDMKQKPRSDRDKAGIPEMIPVPNGAPESIPSTPAAPSAGPTTAPTSSALPANPPSDSRMPLAPMPGAMLPDPSRPIPPAGIEPPMDPQSGAMRFRAWQQAQGPNYPPAYPNPVQPAVYPQPTAGQPLPAYPNTAQPAVYQQPPGQQPPQGTFYR